MNLSNSEGYGALLLVLQQLLKEKLEQEGKGQDNPVPGKKQDFRNIVSRNNWHCTLFSSTYLSQARLATISPA